MAKFTSSLRKSLAATPMTSESEISLVNPLAASLEDVSSDTLPSKMKSKKFFSFRRTGLETTQRVEESNAHSIGRFGLRLRAGPKSNPDIHKSLSKSKKKASFATLFFRGSTPSWSSKRGLRITLAQSPTLVAASFESKSPRVSQGRAPTLSSGDARPVTIKQDSFDQDSEYQESWSPLAENLAGLGLGGILLSDASSMSGSQSYVPGSSDSDSESSKTSAEIGYWSTLPIPPIIISAPTPPPDALWFTDESYAGAQEQVRLANYAQKIPSDSEGVKGHTNFSQVPMIVTTLQSAARQMANDPSFTQTSVFRLSAPIMAFLFVLGIGFIILKKFAVVFSEPGTRKPLEITVYVGLSTLGMLALLRGIIWVMSRMGRSFCELDLEEVFARGISVDSEGKRLTEADFIVGNLIR